MRASGASEAATEQTIAARYRVEHPLGTGGMAAVFAVIDTATGRRLALKRLLPGAGAAAAALFEREYQTLAGLKHPCIVEVYDYDSDAQGPFYTMELIEGGDLGKAAPLPWREACRALRDGASILGLLHARHLLHRDVSPRNFLRARDGALKLIDFGALASFGLNTALVGTPPFVAPEALQRRALDQRSDIFGLGALAYWLLTGVHAFPARSLDELPGLWKRVPAAPSDMLSLLRETNLAPIPPELDVLVSSMLRIDPSERLSSTGELIDRLNELAELSPDSDEVAARGYLDSKAFVGRAREQERALSLLQAAGEGRMQALLIEGDAGIGRTRFMRELVVRAQLAGALAVALDAGHAAKPFGTASALLLHLLRVVPEPTRQALAPDAALLGAISPELQARLGCTPEPAPRQTRELRPALLAALRAALLRLSRERLLALFVDDADEIDEESQALLTMLAGSEVGHRLLLVLSLTRDPKKGSSTPLVNLRSSAHRMRLLPLTPGELLELLRSVFGQVPYLERLAERLHRASDGNPAYCLELAQHLVNTGAATYNDGTWRLPAELSHASLPANRYATHLAQLDHISPEARSVARAISVPHEPSFTLDQCAAAAALPEPRVGELLGELVRARVLAASADGYRFARADVQKVLFSELTEPDRVAAHLRLAAAMSGPAMRDDRAMFRVALHFFYAGDLRRAHVKLRHAIESFDRGNDFRWLPGVASSLEEIHVLQCRLGQDDYAKVGVLGFLALCGFFAERRYAEQYGDDAIATGERVLRLALARKLARFVGGKLALIIALVIAGVALGRHRERAPSLKLQLRLFMAAATALAGTATICLDAERIERFAAVLRPFTVLGREHVATVTYQFVANLVPYLRERLSEAERTMEAYVRRLKDPAPIRGLPALSRQAYIAGTLITLGVTESWCDADKCLATADELEGFSPLHAMNADHLRASYYGSQGDIERAEHYRRRVESHAVTLGSAWQVDIWGVAEGIKLGLRTNNAPLLKRTVQELHRLSSELPAMREVERAAHGAYLVLRGKYSEAIPLLRAHSGPPRLGLARSHGMLARAYNALGQHAEARQVCLEALARLEPADAKYVVMNLNVHIELALAECGLGDVQSASTRLDELLERHAPGHSHITLGALHHARARVALREPDFARARAHLASMEEHYRASHVATLIELVLPMRREIERTENPLAGEQELDELRAGGQHTMMRLRWLLSQTGATELAVRAQRGLQLALELTHADAGLLVMAREHGASVAHLGSGAPSEELVRWAEESMLQADADEQTLITADVDATEQSNYKVVGETRYCVVPLWSSDAQQRDVVAALVLGFDNQVPRLPEPAVMRAIALHLSGAATD